MMMMMKVVKTVKSLVERRGELRGSVDELAKSKQANTSDERLYTLETAR